MVKRSIGQKKQFFCSILKYGGKYMIAEVIINRAAKKLNKGFDYKIPKELEEIVAVGSKVLVPFGNTKKLEEPKKKKSWKFWQKD